MDDWYKISIADFAKLGGATLLHHTSFSPVTAVTSAFTEHKWDIWRFETAPKGFWDDVETQKKFLLYLFSLASFVFFHIFYNLSLFPPPPPFPLHTFLFFLSCITVITAHC